VENDTVIIGVSGKKQSGKSSLCKYLQAWYFCNFEKKDVEFEQLKNGEIVFKNTDVNCVQNSDCKIYSFADPLKKFCIDVMGLSYEWCYGTELDKNSLTKYKWDNLPIDIRIKYSICIEPVHDIVITTEKEDSEGFACISNISCKGGEALPRIGPMTAREILQVFGTNVMRNMFSSTIWVDGTINTIKNYKAKIAFVADTRFVSEVNAIMDEKNGYLIRLQRKISDDIHPSEVELDNFDFNKFGDRVLVIDNNNMTLENQCQIALEFFKKILNI
jgi:hypothetical protein